MSEPKRVQMSRQRPWRADNPDAVIVDRSTRWGNPFTIEGAIESGFAIEATGARRLCVESFADVMRHMERSAWWFEYGAKRFYRIQADLHELRGHDLACWCPLDQPCHADVLLEIANRGDGDGHGEGA